MDRRRFIKICSASALIAGIQGSRAGLAGAAELTEFKRVKLVDGKGQPIKAGRLSNEAYIFNYPYKGTPAFLINLAAKPTENVKLSADAGDYSWEGGVGPNSSIIALTAICSHQLSYPTRTGSPINYYSTIKSEDAGKSGVIVCCEHDRVYDPGQGGKMIATNKKATQPLAAIRLEHDPATDELYAKGVYGALRFDDFFKAYKRELMEEYGPGVAKQEAEDSTTTILLSEYSLQRDQC